MKAAFYTLGCKLNQSETEAVASFYKNQGFEITDIESKADVYIVNTCTVTSKSEQKARRVIRNLLKNHPQSLVVVTGCYAQVEKESLQAISSKVLVLPQSEKSHLFDLAQKILENNTNIIEENGSFSVKKAGDHFKFNVDKFQFHSRAFLKIQDGCDNLCAYCRVPLARGKSVSLEPEKVIQRALKLQDAGYREIVLTGVNITAYEKGSMDFPAILNELATNLTGMRIRLSSLEPEKIDETLAGVLEHKNICPHFHIPLQSGSDAVLQGMKRRYNKAKILSGLQLLRSVKPMAFFSGDVITGFPGETDDDFRQTLELVTDRAFAGLHVFQFSPRPGTAAHTYKNQVPERIRKERAALLGVRAGELFTQYVNQFKGYTVEAVLEKELSSELGIWTGLTENYLKIKVSLPEAAAKGSLVKAEITSPGETSEASFLSLA